MHRTSSLLRGLLLPLLVACGGGADAPDAAPADAARVDAAVDARGGSTLAEGLITVMFESIDQVEPDLVDVTFHAWTPSAVDPDDVFGHHEREIASGAALAIGACGAVAQPPESPVTGIAGSDQVTFSSGGATIALEVEAPGRYFGRDDALPARHLDRDLTLTLGAGSEPHGGPGAIALGRVPGLAGGSSSLSCVRGAACPLEVTLQPVEELYVVVALGQVCRLDPVQAPALPAAALAQEADGVHTLRLYAVRRRPATLGDAAYQTIVVHELAMAFDLAPAAGGR
jgi:hypothetical protein